MEPSELQRIRATPLDAVLEGFGAQRDPKDPKRNWRVGHSRITVTGDRFFDHNEARGSGGAIDLTLHLMGRNPRHVTRSDLEAVVTRLGSSPASTAPSATSRRPASPRQEAAGSTDVAPDPTRLARARWYLMQQRGIPAALVDATITRGLLFADVRANVLFRLRDEAGRPVGFEARGTFDKPFHAVHGKKGLFFIGSGQARSAAFVESAIEALSYKALHPQALVISTTGNAVELPQRMAERLLARGVEVLAAFNADPDGDRFAARFIERLQGRARRHRPDGQKDWNLVLRSPPDRRRNEQPALAADLAR